MADIIIMKYKVGDKVIIKTWADMKAQYGFTPRSLTEDLIGAGRYSFNDEMEEKLNKERILTISQIHNGYYTMKEMFSIYRWTDEMIECLLDPIDTRFEIMDL